ncbi:MAG: hypothetical protein HOJ16_00500 [Candidatus Peribacter sp.]|jgi:hypothetical protein|nr:hypothetical protein [Candidatus Peribacter sp.]
MEYLFLAVSITLNIILIYYAAKVAKRLMIASTNTDMLKETFESFLASVQAMHESEMYYGDQSLQTLMEQTKDIIVDLQEFESIFSLESLTEEEELEEEES